MTQAVFVVSYTLPEDMAEGHAKLQDIAERARPLFSDIPDVTIHVAIADPAEAIVEILTGE